jgi:molybdopterin-containing oxidoreductase family iron-sulfur binding subunit
MLQQPVRGNYEIVRDHWRQSGLWEDFENSWRQAVHDGFIGRSALPPRPVRLRPVSSAPLEDGAITGHASANAGNSLEITFHPDPSVWDGRFANNGWLQELPKPISKLTWDNAALISPALAKNRGLVDGDVVELLFQGRAVRAPVWITPGQAENSVALHVGHGRSKVGRVGSGVGCDVSPLRTASDFWFGPGLEITRTGRKYPLASTRNEHVVQGRDILFTGTLRQYLGDGSFVNQAATREGAEEPARNDTLYDPKEHEYAGYKWGMAIDLTACVGCNACVIACQAENNIPVVGKEQVAKGRDMAWIRIDSYFSGGVENPEIDHQPVPCMHCENAPCELVCPVAATVHDHEGLNVQVYNRCVGTRYCSNNCPYKVRRFNFFQYADYRTPSLKPMRNPNVTVRWRGVMEKCTYCVQRISAARITAKERDRPIRDGEFQTACQQACPAQAIVFGNIGDPESRVARLKTHPLNYSMLGELNTRPRTTYLARIRNPNPALDRRNESQDHD